MKNFKYITPDSAQHASELGKGSKTVYMAGGTDLLGVLKDKITPSYPEKVVNLKSVEGLDTIEKREDGLHIGSMVTLANIAASTTVRQGWNALADAAYSIATPNLRNTATLGGNLCQDIRCWYYRYPDVLGGMIDCARKEGHLCSAMMGENRYHSIFGAAKVCETACTNECPAHTDISAYMELLRKGDIDGAARILMEVNPMPAITGRVCAHFCMEGCNRNKYDESLNVGSVERYLGDYILDHHTKFMKAPTSENGKRVSIIGSGPAGLAAAYYLRQSGYAVTVYEKQKEAGGCLTYAIPAYRLPKEIVSNFISILTDMGIVFKCSVNVGKDITTEEIYKNSDSVMLDTGTWKRPLIGLAGEELTRFGLDFLVDVNSYLPQQLGSRVVVVGGGNVAMDVAITAKRLGSTDVKMVCLEQRNSMPANKEEIERALEEGVEILNGWGPNQIFKTDGKFSGIEFKSCPKVLDETGRFNPTYDETNLMKLDADVVLMAIGQRSDLDFLEGSYTVETQRGRIIATENNETTVPGIFAGGDVTTGPATVIAAIAAGKSTALAINKYCGGSALEVEKVVNSRVREGLLSFNSNCVSCKEAKKQELLPVTERRMDMEDMKGISTVEMGEEASRCFNCGCLAVNPSDMANMLYAYNAKVVTNMRSIDAKTFFTSHTKITDTLMPGEFVTEVVVPTLPEGTIARYDKFRIRKAIDFAVLGVATVRHMTGNKVDDISIVLGAVAPVPMKMSEAEAVLRGCELTEKTAAEAAEVALKDAVPLKMNSYKIEIAKVMIRRALGF